MSSGTKAAGDRGRAPTLLASEHGLAADQVRVWAPRGATRRLTALVCGGPLAAAALLLAHFEPALLIVAAPLAAGAGSLLRHGTFLTTDGSGLAVSTRQGSRVARWSEVQSVERVERPTGFFLKLDLPDAVEVDLAGYPESQQLALFRLIIARAGLWWRDPRRPGRYVKTPGA